MKVKLNGRDVQALLNGFLCVYKPRDLHLEALKELVIARICQDGNALEDAFVPTIRVPVVEPHPKSKALVVTGTRKQLDYKSHPLMIGHLFRPEDIRLEELKPLDEASSGVCLFGINDGCEELERIRENVWVNEYYLEGELGRANKGHEIRGLLTEKAKYDFVNQHKIEKLFAKLQMQYKRTAFEYCEFDLQSEEAFELARRGAPKAKIPGSQIVYGLELKRFRSPFMTVRFQLIGETDYFLRAFIYEIGCSLETLACTRKLRRTRLGPFSIDHALLDKHLHLETILKNIRMCNRIVDSTLIESSDVIRTDTLNDRKNRELVDAFKLNPLECEQLEEEADCLRISWGRDYT